MKSDLMMKIDYACRKIKKGGIVLLNQTNLFAIFVIRYSKNNCFSNIRMG